MNSVWKSKFTTLLYSMVFIPFLRPNGLTKLMPQSTKMFDIACIALLVLGFVLQIKRNKAFNKLLLATTILFIHLLATTFFYKGNYYTHFSLMVVSIGIICYIDLFSDNPKNLLSALLLNHEILIYINAICIILYPKGMYLAYDTYGSNHNWFMGYDNHWFIFYFSAYSLAAINMHYHPNSKRSILMILVLNITTIYVHSGVLLIGIFLLDIIYLFKIFKKKWFVLKTAMTIGISTSVIIIFFSYFELIEYLVNAFEKTRSYAARLNIWHIALSVFNDNFIMGIGRRSNDENRIRYGLMAGVNAHNMWVEILFQGGIIAGVLFLVIFIIVDKKTKENNHYTNNIIYSLSLPALFSMLVTFAIDAVMEVRGVMFFGVLAIIYCSKELSDRMEN